MGGMKEFPGKWHISDEEYPRFLDLLHDYLFKVKGRPINLVEQPRLDKAKPILIDLDFKFPVDTALTHRFTAEQINTFVTYVSKGLTTFFETERYEGIRFFVSLRPQAYADGTKCVKDGVHIQCPDMCLTNDKQRALRLWLLEQKAVENSFGDIGFNNAPADIYDESMMRKQGWFFYGESKPSIPPYALTTVLSVNPEGGMIEEQDISIYSSRDLMGLLSVRYDLQEDDNEVRPAAKALYDKMLKPAPAPQVRETPESAKTAPAPIGVYIPEEHDDEEIELAKVITLNCLSTKRADDYKTWMDVGWCLSNISKTEEMFDTWVEFSKKSTKSAGTDWGKLKRDWFNTFSRNTPGAKLTLKSLHYWARSDSPDTYKELIEEDLIRYVQYRTDDTNYHVAKLAQKMYKGEFCASIERRGTEWYVFDKRNHTWRHTNQGIELRQKLSTEVVDLVIRARLRLKKKGWDAHCAQNQTAENMPPDEDWHKSWSGTPDGQRFMTLMKLEKHLYACDFKNAVMKEASERFKEEDFGNRLNMNTNLLACGNGVIDLRNEIRDPVTGNTSIKVIFRDGKPDDYMSFLAGRNFPDTDAIHYTPYDPNSPVQQELMEFLSKIFPDTDLRNYYIRLMASCLEGANREQCYYTLIGCGGNGKSKLVDLMKYTLGDYASSLQATALTRKRPDSGAANPDIISIKGVRYIYLQEPDDKEPLNTSRMKQFSGEDLVEARALFGDQEKFRICGKLFMMCNRLPPITQMDNGTWRRIRAIPFVSKFVDATDPELIAGRPNVFLRDNDLDAKLRTWREAWLSLLVHVFETEYLVSGLQPIPAAVMEESNKYKETFDQYGKFKGERMIDFRNPRLGLEETGDERVTFKDVWTAYKKWLAANDGMKSGAKLTEKELQNRLDQDFGNLDGGVYKRVLVFFDEETKTEEETGRKLILAE